MKSSAVEVNTGDRVEMLAGKQMASRVAGKQVTDSMAGRDVAEW